MKRIKMKHSQQLGSSSIRFAAGILLSTYLSLSRTNVSGFTGQQLNSQARRRHLDGVRWFLAQAEQGGNNHDDDETLPWMKRGLLISSFHDGVLNNPPAQEFLMDSLVQAIWDDHRERAERAVHESALQSPCCGPNMVALEQLEQIDQAMMAQQKMKQPLLSLLPSNAQLRLVYIPTAMYAIRSDSQNTPGKQRQRARADAKQRRTTIVQFLQEQLGGNQVNILSVTLDLDDGSIKQAEGSSNADLFPKNGMDALQQWAPHLIYIEGGNTFWSHYCMKKGGWDSILVQACRRAVYCGKSAGAILAGYSVETACWKGWDDPSIIPGMSDYSSWKSVRGLGLVGKTSFFPHMADEWDNCVQTCSQDLDDVCCLTDIQACCVDGNARVWHTEVRSDEGHTSRRQAMI